MMNTVTTRQQGFTIIELLTVIAIIGILAGIILASLNDARYSGIDAKVQSELEFLAKRAEIESAQHFSYDTVCGTNGVATSSETLAIVTSINAFASSTVVCNGNAAAYAASAPFGTVFWCVDSTGAKKEIPNALTAGQVACP